MATRYTRRRLLGLGPLSSSPALAAERTITLAVQNMDCPRVRLWSKRPWKPCPGVAKVTVSYHDRAAVVTYDDRKAAMKAVVTAATNAGYPSAPES